MRERERACVSERYARVRSTNTCKKKHKIDNEEYIDRKKMYPYNTYTLHTCTHRYTHPTSIHTFYHPHFLQPVYSKAIPVRLHSCESISSYHFMLPSITLKSVIYTSCNIKYIQNPFDFFITSDYNFSLVWAIVWFVIVLLIHIKSRKENIDKYIDPLVITFVFIVFIGFIWWFLGGQVYGRETQFGIEILYTHSFTPVPYQVPVFPLPLIYAGLYFLLFCLLYIGSMYVHLRWVLGYFGLIIFSCILLIFEFFSGKYDIFYNTFNINMTQIFSILLIIVCIYRLFLIMKKNEGKDITILHKN